MSISYRQDSDNFDKNLRQVDDMQEGQENVLKEMERLEEKLDALFREMGGASPLLLSRASKAAM